jgi:hypothetical protein
MKIKKFFMGLMLRGLIFMKQRIFLMVIGKV